MAEDGLQTKFSFPRLIVFVPFCLLVEPDARPPIRQQIRAIVEEVANRNAVVVLGLPGSGCTSMIGFIAHSLIVGASAP